jgi:hypothetical protein
MYKDDEHIFEGAVLEEHILHKVSLENLLDRRLDMERYCEYTDLKGNVHPLIF